MEKVGDGRHEEEEEQKLKSHTAIRCAKTAILISTLQSSMNSLSANNSNKFQIEEKVEMLERDKLKLEFVVKRLVKEKKKRGLWVRAGMVFFSPPLLILLLAIADFL